MISASFLPLPLAGIQIKSSILYVILLRLCYWHLAFISRVIYDNCTGFESVMDKAQNSFHVQTLSAIGTRACADAVGACRRSAFGASSAPNPGLETVAASGSWLSPLSRAALRRLGLSHPAGRAAHGPGPAGSGISGRSRIPGLFFSSQALPAPLLLSPPVSVRLLLEREKERGVLLPSPALGICSLHLPMEKLRPGGGELPAPDHTAAGVGVRTHPCGCVRGTFKSYNSCPLPAQLHLPSASSISLSQEC